MSRRNFFDNTYSTNPSLNYNKDIIDYNSSLDDINEQELIYRAQNNSFSIKSFMFISALIVVIIIVVVLIFYFIKPNKPNTLLYSKTCPACIKVINLLDTNKSLDALVYRVDVDSNEGKKLSRELNVTHVPFIFKTDNKNIVYDNNGGDIMNFLKK